MVIDLSESQESLLEKIGEIVMPMHIDVSQQMYEQWIMTDYALLKQAFTTIYYPRLKDFLYHMSTVSYIDQIGT